MTKTSVFYPKGVCSRRYEITLKDGVVEDIVIDGGCNGNLQGLSRMVKGRPAAEVISLLEGVDCGGRGTSCPDQISKALREML